MHKKVIYTAIFGGKDSLHEPRFIPAGFDFVCFTDDASLVSDVWQVRVVVPPHTDPVRSARMYKIRAHRFLQEYEESVWIDGNMIVVGDAESLVSEYLPENSFAVYNHASQKRRIAGLLWIRDRKLGRDCIYEEAKDLLSKNERGIFMDDSDLIRSQVARYRREQYPAHNGLAVTMVLIRRHNDARVVEAMEMWWRELEAGSRRDQLSFNYIAWKLSFPFVYIKGDPRYNRYFSKVRHQKKENFRT